MISKTEATQETNTKWQALSFRSLPEEIKEIILARVSRWNYPKLSLVSKNFHFLLSPMNIYKTRSHMGTTETCFYICLKKRNHESYSWFILQAKPNRTETKWFKQNPSENMLVPPILSPCSDSLPVPCCSTIAVGSEIYVIGGTLEPSSTVRVLDCRSHTWRNAPNMKVTREEAQAVSLDEKIYVMGGCESNHSAHWLEVFDIKTQSWTAFPGPCDDPGKFIDGRVIKGKLHVLTDTKDYDYDPKQGTWKVVREPSISDEILVRWCVVENVICCRTEARDCMWYDTEGGKCEAIKGLEKLREHPQPGLSSGTVIDLVNYGGNLLVIWETYVIRRKTKVWYAEISLETRCNGSEVWGNVEWVDVMCILPRYSYDTLLCLNVSV